MSGKPEVDETALKNLLERRKIYGDITQNSSNEEIEILLRYHDNNVPKVISALDEKIKTQGYHTFIPPAFYDRVGVLVRQTFSSEFHHYMALNVVVLKIARQYHN